MCALLTLAAPIPYVVYAESYLTEDQAAAVLFPGVTLEAGWVLLTPEQVKSIENKSGEKVLRQKLRVWRGPAGETMIVDRVIGKHELITYALAILSNGTVKGVEILDYKEAYGYEIRRPKWRRHFVGKSRQDPLKLRKDIPNITGATLSCMHVTDGIRRLLNTYEVLA
jgi:Na+-translocating ferredoxin:NAD+ oxidoreductase RnfG subunit